MIHNTSFFDKKNTYELLLLISVSEFFCFFIIELLLKLIKYSIRTMNFRSKLITKQIKIPTST